MCKMQYVKTGEKGYPLQSIYKAIGADKVRVLLVYFGLLYVSEDLRLWKFGTLCDGLGLLC